MKIYANYQNSHNAPKFYLAFENTGCYEQATTVWSTPTIPSSSTSWPSPPSTSSMPFYPWHNTGATPSSGEQLSGSNHGMTGSPPASIGDAPPTSSASPSGPVVINGKETPPSMSGTPTYQQQHQQNQQHQGGFFPLHGGSNSGVSSSPLGTSTSPNLGSEHSHYPHHASSYTHHHPHHHPHAHPHHHHQIHMSSLQHFTNGGYGLSMMTDPSFKFHPAGIYQQQMGSPNSVTSDQGHAGYCSSSSLGGSNGREHSGAGTVDVVATTANEPSGIVRWSPLTPPHHPQTAHNLA